MNSEYKLNLIFNRTTQGIIGINNDLFTGITKDFEHFNYKIIVFDRHGYKKKSFNSISFKRLNGKNLNFIKFKKVNISSSQLRKI